MSMKAIFVWGLGLAAAGLAISGPAGSIPGPVGLIHAWKVDDGETNAKEVFLRRYSFLSEER